MHKKADTIPPHMAIKAMSALVQLNTNIAESINYE